jgi:hypothetical protein
MVGWYLAESNTFIVKPQPPPTRWQKFCRWLRSKFYRTKEEKCSAKVII